MTDTPPHLQALEEVERAGIPGLLEVLREEGIDGVRYALRNVSGWHRDYSPPVWRNRATEEQKWVGWERAVRTEKIIATVLDEAHERQVEEVMDTLQEGPECLDKRPPYPRLGSGRPLEAHLSRVVCQQGTEPKAGRSVSLGGLYP